MDCHACGRPLEDSDTFCGLGCGRTRVVPTDSEAASASPAPLLVSASTNVFPRYNALALWTAPGEPHDVIANLGARVALRVIADAGTYLEVELPSGSTGYVVKQYVADAAPPREYAAPEPAEARPAGLSEPARIPDAPTSAEARPASFRRRVAGWLVDTVVTGAAAFAIALGLYDLLLPQNFTQARYDGARLSVLAIVSAGGFAYNWIGNSLGGTVGKRIVSIRVVDDATGGDPGLGSGFARAVIAIASGLVLWLGYLSAAWDKQNKTWHDKAAGTSVVNAPGQPRQLLPVLGTACAIVLVIVAVMSFRDLRGHHLVASTDAALSSAQANAEFRTGYIAGCRNPADWKLAGIADPARIDRICGCVADVILAHYPLSQVVSDARRLNATDPAGYTKFLLQGPYRAEIAGCLQN